MTTCIHPTAVVDPAAELAEGVHVGPHAVIEGEVTVGKGTEIRAGAFVQGPSRIGRDNVIFPGACIGTDPQDLKYRSERTFLEIGDRNCFREFCSVNRGTAGGGGVTRLGDDNLLMTTSHVGHDCQVGSRVVLVNGVALAGHVKVDDDATLSAYTSVHQFCRVGRHAYVGGYSVVTQDALPFVKIVGQRPVCLGINRIGLQRKGFEPEAIVRLETGFRLLTRSGLNLSQAVDKLREELGGHPEIDHLIDFVTSAERGVIRAVPSSRRSRGGAD
jgi:UDP-N-acetylglucosamine acyltransferase